MNDGAYYSIGADLRPFWSSPDLLNITFATPNPPPGWRRTPPAEATGTGAMLLYGQELAELARDLPGFRDGCAVNANYRKVNGEWFPIPESVRIV